ncbi:PH-domain-containing protein [Meira miltonrushii]|uniref:PH-domain-containing protein n=1 Tax=Meira miltonrushii TaxID=1280837 RepID=A0A316V7R3_9BASI|nr:PH-domain-containing protein [Meira miltonrushii]PWN33647.1 PH-domain-containing protein [Meira miltonrushii]
MKTEATQQNSSSSGGMGSTQPMRTSSTRSSVQHQEGIHPHTMDHAAESMEEEGGYDGEDGEDDDDEGMPIGQQGGEQEMLSETTVKSGYLYKRGEKRKNWKKRWFVLRSAKLYYYKNEKEYQLLRFIDMTEVHTIASVELKKVEHCFGISTSKRQYYVRATSAKEMASWVDALRDVREQVRQRSTLTRDMALLDVGNVSSGGEHQAPAHASATPKNASQAASPTVKPIDQVGSPKGKQGTGSQPISIMIPGKGLYTAPTQSRITSANPVLSPLTATSDSEAGGPSGAEQFGLSYASSAGQSLASSPGRSGLFHHSGYVLHQQHQTQQTDYSSGGGHSPQSHSGGDEGAEMIRGKRGPQRGSGFREASVGSSTGEGAATGLARRRSDSQQAGHPLSSSEDEGEGEGDDWDEEEEADLAMPLPNTGGLSLMSSFSHGHGTQASSKQPQPSGSEPSSSVVTTVSKPKVGPEFFKDSSKVIHQGYLMKQSNRRKHWRKRWFVLTSGSLSYTRSHMDAKPHRQIPLSSILDAIEYTSKKANQHSAPLSPSLGAFAGSNPLASFGRSPLLGGGGDSTNALERRGSTQSKGASALQTSNAGLVPSSDHEHGAISANEAESGNERRGSGPNAGADPKQPATPAKKKKENCFKIITPKRVYIVCAPTEEEELKWLSALQALLTHFHEKDKSSAPASTNANEGSQERQEQQVTSPIQPGSPAQTPVALNRLNAPSISLSKPIRQGSQDDTRATAQEGLKAT